ncbi:unnamed protein product [Calypogeia fissa]
MELVVANKRRIPCLELLHRTTASVSAAYNEPCPSTNKRSRRLSELPRGDEELLPGINNDITLAHITTKLPWRLICVMSAASRGWRQAIQNHSVYKERVLRNSTETFVLVLRNIGTTSELRFGFSIYSTTAKSWHTLPSIPHSIQYEHKFVTADAKVYVLGNDSKLYELDLAGRRQWKQCGGFQQLYKSYELAVMGGKVYQFMSTDYPTAVFGLDVFDPKRNVLSLIKRTEGLFRRDFQVAVAGEELVVYGGFSYGRGQFSRGEPVVWLDFYHPGKNEWRVMKSFGRPEEQLFVAGGRFYSLTLKDIHVYDVQGNSWAHLHSFSFPSFNPFNPPIEPAKGLGINMYGEMYDELFELLHEFLYMEMHEEMYGVNLQSITVVGNELLAQCWERFDQGRPGDRRSCLLQTRGFGSQDKQLEWQKVEFPFHLERQQLLLYSPQIALIQI